MRLTNPSLTRTLQPIGVPLTPVEGVPYTGVVATFMDTVGVSASPPPTASDYNAYIDWGDGTFVSATVTSAGAPGIFTISGTSPAPLSNPDALISAMVSYATGGTPTTSRPASLSEPIQVIPTAPSGLSATAASDSEIDLAWTNNSAVATGVEIDRSADGVTYSELAAVPATPASYADTGLSAGALYYYRIEAINGPQFSTGVFASAYTEPALTASAVAANEVALSWSVAATGISGFDIERSEDGGATFVTIDSVDPSTTAYTDWSAQGNTPYVYEVVANLAGGSLTSAPVMVTTPVAGVTDLGVSGVDGDEIDLSWDAVAGGVTAIDVYRATSGGAYVPLTTTLAADATGFQDTGLAAGTFYAYEVCTVGSGGTSAFSDVESWTLTDTAQAISPINVSAGGSVNGVLTDFSGTFADGNAADYTAAVDWGDGNTTAGIVTSDGNGGFNVSGSHVFLIPAVDVVAIALNVPGGDVLNAYCGGVWVSDTAPTVATPASAVLSADGTTATLNVLGDDDAGEEDLTYTWATLGTPPAAVTFDDNGDNDSKEALATFTAAGSYDFQVTIANSAGLSVTSDVSLNVTQIGSDIEVTPDSPTVMAGQSVQLSAVEYDQFGAAMATQPEFFWSMEDGEGSVDSTGLYTAPLTADGTADITVDAFDGEEGGTSICITPVVQITSVTPQFVASNANLDGELQYTWTAPADAQLATEVAGPDGNYYAVAAGDASYYPYDLIYGLQSQTTYSVRLVATIGDQQIISPVVTATTSETPDDDLPAPILSSPSGALVLYTQPSYDASRYTPVNTIYEMADPTDPSVSQHILTVGPEAGGYDLTVLPASGLTVRCIEAYTDNETGQTVFSPPGELDLSSPTATLAAPQNLTCTYLGNGQFSVQWTGGDDSESVGVDSSPTADSQAASLDIQPPGTNSFTVTGGGGLAGVWFVDGSNTSPVSFIRLPAALVQAPGITTAVPFYYNDSNNNQQVGVRVFWTDQSSDETGFVVYRSDQLNGTYDAVSGDLPADTTSFDDKTYTPGSNVYYKVEAFNDFDSGGEAGPIAMVLAPTPASNLTAEINDDGTIGLSWTAGSGQSEIQWTTTPSDPTTWIPIDTVPDGGTTYTDETPSVGEQNCYRIVSYAPAGGGSDVTLYATPSNFASDEPIWAPVAVDDTNGGVNGDVPYTVQGNATLTVPASIGLLANDSDPNGFPIHVSAYDPNTEHGTLQINPDGSFTYTPNGTFAGVEYFNYTISNGSLTSTAEAAISVVNTPPVASNASYSLTTNGTFSVASNAANGLVSKVADATGGALSFRLAPNGGAMHGSLTLNSNGSFTYTPNASFQGYDNFLYIANDGINDSNPAEVVITLAGAHYKIPTATTALPAMFDDSGSGLVASYNAAQERLTATMSAYAAFGAAVQAAATAAQSVPAMNLEFQQLEQLQSAYNTYILQLTASNNVAAKYLLDRWVNLGTDLQTVQLIQNMPTNIAGLTTDDAQAFGLGQAQNFLESSEGFVLNEANWSIAEAHDIHDSAQATLIVGGYAAIAEAGLEVVTEEGCAAAAQYSAKTILAVYASQQAGKLVGAGMQLAKDCGVDPQYVQIGADALQVTLLLLAARNQALAREAQCFTGDTAVKVETANGVADEAIDDIHLGDRVDATVNDGNDPGAPPPASDGTTAVDPETWREVDLTMPDPANPGDNYTMQLLEPISWIAANNASAGNWVNLDLPELQISGPAQVTAIKACPPIESGLGDVVLGTFQHVSNDIVDVNLAGEDQALQVTSGHLLWSLDRNGWVAAGDLKRGERVAGENGSVVVESVTADSEVQEVYNLDVEDDHRYLVTSGGVVAHNADPLCGHDADWNLRASNGRFMGGGSESSGVDFPLEPGQKLSFPEQSWYGHTEGKIISDLMEDGKLQPGSTLQIQGTAPPCPQCRNIMQWASGTFKMKISYEDATGKAWAWINGTPVD